MSLPQVVLPATRSSTRSDFPRLHPTQPRTPPGTGYLNLSGQHVPAPCHPLSEKHSPLTSNLNLLSFHLVQFWGPDTDSLTGMKILLTAQAVFFSNNKLILILRKHIYEKSCYNSSRINAENQSVCQFSLFQENYNYEYYSIQHGNMCCNVYGCTMKLQTLFFFHLNLNSSIGSNENYMLIWHVISCHH